MCSKIQRLDFDSQNFVWTNRKIATSQIKATTVNDRRFDVNKAYDACLPNFNTVMNNC